MPVLNTKKASTGAPHRCLSHPLIMKTPHRSDVSGERTDSVTKLKGSLSVVDDLVQLQQNHRSDLNLTSDQRI